MTCARHGKSKNAEINYVIKISKDSESRLSSTLVEISFEQEESSFVVQFPTLTPRVDAMKLSVHAVHDSRQLLFLLPTPKAHVPI